MVDYENSYELLMRKLWEEGRRSELFQVFLDECFQFRVGRARGVDADDISALIEQEEARDGLDLIVHAYR